MAGKQKSKACEHDMCFRSPEPGSKFCAKHANDDPNKFPFMTCGVMLLIAIAIGVWIFRAVTGSADSGTTSNVTSGTVSGGKSDAALAADASTSLSTFSGDPAYALVDSVDVKSGVLWIYTSIPAGDTASAVAVCGLGSSWVYGDSDAISHGLWGVSVRASDGQRLIQRNGSSDSCS